VPRKLTQKGSKQTPGTQNPEITLKYSQDRKKTAQAHPTQPKSQNRHFSSIIEFFVGFVGSVLTLRNSITYQNTNQRKTQ
jgi:hypothetical protein